MQLRLALRTGLVLGTFGASNSAFVVSPKRHSISLTRLGAKAGQGWDNENYLEALSGGKDALEKANEEYYEQSDFRAQQLERLVAGSSAAQPSQPTSESTFKLTEELRKKIEAGHEEGPGGGTRWKEILEKAQQQAASRPLSVSPPTFVPPVYTPPQQQPQQPSVTPVNPSELSVEEQARLFREMIQQQQPQVYPAQAPAPQYDPYSLPQRPSRPDPRPVGRNRDADAISNTSDLYIAQLKYDSAVRNIARYRGDESKANAVFQDEGIEKLKDELLKNPYLTSPQQSMVGSSADEYLMAQMTLESERKVEAPVDITSAGISYKEKLRQLQQQKQQQPNEVKTDAPASSSSVTSAPEAQQTPKAAATTSAQVSANVPATATPGAAASPTKPLETISSTSTAFQRPRVATPQAAPAPTASSSSSDSDDLRGEVRTLMGLLLKHRGGPGFGSGRLKGPDLERFERMLSQVTEKLQQEAGIDNTQSTIPSPKQTVSSKTTPPPPKQQPKQPLQQHQAPHQPVTQQRPQPVTQQSGAIAMAETIPAGERIQRMIACIEGALQMYKNSPPELQEGLLITMRSALMTAVTTCNQVIAENELRNYETYQSLAESATTSRATPPSQFYDVVQVQDNDEDDETEAFAMEQQDHVTEVDENFPTSLASPELDENSKMLESIYQQLKAAAGDGKLGLKPNLSSEEAANLSNSLLDMRAILMEELESGIPSATVEKQQPPPPSAVSPNNQGASANSKYQEMLAKARATKAGQK